MLNPFEFVAPDIAVMVGVGCAVVAAVFVFRKGDPP